MFKILIPILVLVPSLAFAEQQCAESSTSTLNLDAETLTALHLKLGVDRVRLTGSDHSDGVLTVRKCASTRKRLEALDIRQVSSGEGRVGIEIRTTRGASSAVPRWLRDGTSNYAYFDIQGSIPARSLVDLELGLGQVSINNVAAVHAQVGLGQLELTNIQGAVVASLGGGHLDAQDIGSLTVDSVGLGQLSAERVLGDVEIGKIGLGGATLKHVDGSVFVRKLGWGTLTVNDVGGDLTLRRKTLGNYSHENVRGSVSVP